LDDFKCMQCEHVKENRGKFIYKDYKEILCEVHKNRELNPGEYIEILRVNDYLSEVLDQLEITFIEFQICIALVEMFQKEGKALKTNVDALKQFQEELNDEIKKLNNMFTGGTFYLKNFYAFHFKMAQLDLLLLIFIVCFFPFGRF
jgi:cell division protein FtsB